MEMPKWSLPDLTRPRNEILFYLGVFKTVIAGLIVILADADLTSWSGVVAVIPLVLALVARNFTVGPETHKEATNS